MNLSKTMLVLLLAIVAGCQQFSFDNLRSNLDGLRSQSPEEDEALDDEFQTKIDTPLIGEYTRAAGLHPIRLEGVGLVTGLDGTGGDPPPSHLRTMLLEDMRKRNVHSPNTILRSPSTALVMVRAYLPPLVEEGERFDVEVRLPGNSDATSLKGGWLMEMYLTEQAIVPGRGVLTGHVFARAKGPILMATSEDEDEPLAGGLRRGRVLGGAESLHERDMALYLRNDFRSIRNAKRIADRIGDRFHDYDRSGVKESLAEAKTDQKIELKLLSKYKHNYPRFLQVVRNIAFRETLVTRRLRMEQLQEQILQPEQAELAALRLEAIGQQALPALKSALKSPHLEVRFHAAVALAYLDDPAGLPALAEAARKEPAFRVFALAAMSALDEGETHLTLRKLMDDPSAETRYGAFRALTTLDRHDPFVRGELLDEQFLLHVLETAGDPMIHLTHRKKPEVVLFGAEQRFKTPLLLRAGKNILITGRQGESTLTVSRFDLNAPDRREVVSTKVADVIRTAAKFGASYPDVAQMLAEADRQRNTPAPIQIDALPRAGRVYIRPQEALAGGYQNEARVGNENLVPNLFDTGMEPADADRPNAEDSADDSPSPDAAADATESDGETSKVREFFSPPEWVGKLKPPFRASQE